MCVRIYIYTFFLEKFRLEVDCIWGDDEYLKDFPPDIKYTMGILITVWNWRSDIGGGNPNASRMQVLIYRSKVKTRFGTTGDWNTVSGGWG